jgi:hypothetical protein
MKNVKVPITTLETLIESLESAINVCNNVDSKSTLKELSYPYAVGYSRTVMLQIREQIKILSYSNS